MLTTLYVTIPIYLIIAAGYLAVRYELFAKLETRVLGRFVMQFSLPALLFSALSRRSLDEVLNGPFLAAYAGGSFAVFFGVYFYVRKVRRQSTAFAALKAMGMSASNSGFIGFPIMLQVIGQPAAVALALTMIVENVLVLPTALALAERGSQGQQGWGSAVAEAARRLIVNPVILAIIAGLSFAAFGWKLPEPIARTVQIVATAASPLALFVIGGSLPGLQFKGLIGDVTLLALGKLLLHPAAVLAMLWMLPEIDPPLRTAAVGFACMPMLSIYPLLAQKFHHDGFCAAALLAATILSFATISAVLWVLNDWLAWTQTG